MEANRTALNRCTVAVLQEGREARSAVVGPVSDLLVDVETTSAPGAVVPLYPRNNGATLQHSGSPPGSRGVRPRPRIRWTAGVQ